MKEEINFTRRQALGLIGGLGISLLCSEAYTKSPSQLCSSHFKGSPDRINGPGGEIYTRQRNGLYRSGSGRIIAVDGADMILSRHFREKEEMWENAIQTGKYNGRALAFADPDVDDLKTCMEGDRWNPLNDEWKQKTRQVWNNSNKEFRKFVCNTYINVFDNFYNRLDNNRKTDFERFVKAYKFAVDNSDNPENEMFKTRDGSVHRTYTTGYPWLCISFPDVSDRALIFGQEIFHQENGRRINWGFVRDKGV